MKESKLIKRLVATFVVIVLGGPAVVLAGAPSHFEDATVTVSYADLNLEKQEGVRVLYRRLQSASKEACGVTRVITAASGRFLGETRRCYRETLSELVEKVDNKALARIHAG